MSAEVTCESCRWWNFSDYIAAPDRFVEVGYCENPDVIEQHGTTADYSCGEHKERGDE